MTLSLYFLSLLLFYSVRLPSAAASDAGSLLEFKKGIQTDPFDRIHSTWNLSSLPHPDACPSWVGVTCDPDTRSVVGIDLTQMGLGGELKFNTLTNLKSLRNLSLSGNHFTGRLVPALGSMSSLQYLDLSRNGFYGPIPRRIADLWGLNYVNLSDNKFKGGFPGGWFRNLQQLRVLDLHGNELWGDVGEVLSSLRNVERVDLSRNQFYGGLELDGDNVSSVANTLRSLNLSHNNLNGALFKEGVIGMFRNLEVLDLGTNGISGELPSSGWSVTNLKVLRLGNNHLFGMIPGELLESLIPIQELDLSGNGFTELNFESELLLV